ncbi:MULTISPECIES: helix-turn-helix domain-containing protein [Acaryochloris]|uniref:helix-turn-helix domain-containing protein n=1 Tax=Acaryochloris TaxID=155977 RepID=UPI001F209372|nr:MULTISPECIES: helix-turn-helix domain-containing protein [Acaryochloris]
MSLTIRERCQAVTDCLFKQGVKGIAKIAAATGLSKSSVHRHQQAIARRNQYPESL